MNKTTEPQMNTDRHRFLYKEETRKLIGCAMEVVNTLGHGLLENPVSYKGVQVGVYIPDLIAFDQIIIDTKTIEHIGNAEKGQMINYLKITGLHVGLIINFKHPKLEWERIVL
ncbi:GxxExxY protein [bacterium]|nr:GxxExxY protein [bacterium]